MGRRRVFPNDAEFVAEYVELKKQGLFDREIAARMFVDQRTLDWSKKRAGITVRELVKQGLVEWKRFR